MDMDKEQQRAAFEEWASNALYSLQRDRADGNYSNVLTRNAWTGWQAAIEQASQPQWVPVSSELPPLGEPVLVALKKHVRWPRTRIMARYVRHHGDLEYFWGVTHGSSNDRAPDDVTHWLPLPPLPQAKEDA